MLSHISSSEEIRINACGTVHSFFYIDKLNESGKFFGPLDSAQLKSYNVSHDNRNDYGARPFA